MSRVSRKLILALIFVNTACSLLTAHAYEVATHAEMSATAYETSVLSNADFLKTLGISATDRFDQDRADRRPPKLNEGTMLGWIREGAVFEDDTSTIKRPLNHFYDPIHDRPLTVGVPIGRRSPDWALEDQSDIGDQAYSLKDAGEYLYRALTLTSEQERNRYFGLTFQTLGHVIHHVQDMAQPEHVRNDQHLDSPEEFLGIIPNPFYDKSLYEEWTNLNRDKLPYTGYGRVRFPTAREYWTTGDERGMADFTNRNFLSKDTNFLLRADGSAAVNSLYPLPFWDSTSNPVPIRTLLSSDGTCPSSSPACGLDGEVIFFGTTVRDTYAGNPAPPNRYASTLSIFDQDLEAYGRPPIYYDDPDDPLLDRVEYQRLFTLNRFNFRSAHSYLIPRAVAYSAGLIDYFFRGRLEAEDIEFTDTGIRLRLRNAIDPAETPAWANEVIGPGGTLLIAYDYKDSNGTPHYRTSNAVALAAAIAPGEVSAAAYTFNVSVPSGVSDVNYRLVYCGRVGQEEDGVAVGAVEPISGFLVRPNYTPADGIAGPRLIERAGGKWRLSDRADLAAGNVDWKGWYRGGRATRVLTWDGPTTRHFPDPIARWGSEIYQNGEFFAFAPSTVLGAGLAKDPSGNEWLVAICKEGTADVVYRRPNKKSHSPDLYDEQTNPDGWKQIGRFELSEDASGLAFEADRPWFFNGPGTEAQTLRRWRKAGDLPHLVQYRRLKMSLDGAIDRASFDEIANESGFRNVVTCAGGYDAHGVGTVQGQSSASGEYTIAVDYKDTEPATRSSWRRRVY